MCGLFGYIGKPSDYNKTAILMEALMFHTRIRGIHSAGYYALNHVESFLEKIAIDPAEFIKTSKMRSTISKKQPYLFMGHNRQASKGAINERNAHPFEGDNFVLTHNGTTQEILEKAKKNSWPMLGDSDSAAILSSLEINGLGGFLDTLESIDNFSLTIFNKDQQILYFARDPGRPLYIADLRNQLGIVVWSSTSQILDSALQQIQIIPTTIKGKEIKPGYLYRISCGDPKIKLIKMEMFRYMVPFDSGIYRRAANRSW